MNKTTKHRQEKDLASAFPQTNISYMCMQMKSNYEKNKMLTHQKQKVRSLTKEYMKN